MRVLLIHQNFPGQFRHAAQAWAARPGWDVRAIGRETAPGMPGLPNLQLLRYKPHRGVRQEQHPYLRRMEDAVLHGQAVARILQRLKREGFAPEVILAHPGWGETLYAKDVFPNTRLIHFSEWFYQVPPLKRLESKDRCEWPFADVGFDPEFPATLDDLARIRTSNALHLLNLEHCDVAISPTQWQKRQHPAAYHDKITVLHEGIDTENLGPDEGAAFKLPNGTVLKAGDPVITYVARNLEPYRGFHTLMRALPSIQAEHQQCQTLIVGGDGVSYGRAPKDAANWREKMLAEVGDKLDPARTHFLGKLPYADYKRLLQVSAAHVYLSYPFVLSWSMLEAMATGCLLIGSDTAPVKEVLRHGQNGLLVPALQPAAVAAGVVQALGDPSAQALRARARADVQARYARSTGVERLEALLYGAASPAPRPQPAAIQHIALESVE